jgi:hypothetical protein
MIAQRLLACATVCSLSLCAPRTSSAQTTIAFTGLVRLHQLSHAEPLHSDPFGRSNDPRPFLQPDSHMIRLGVGVRIAL